MTREKFDLKIDEHCNKNSLFLPRHQSISDPDIRDFLWKLAEDHRNIYDDEHSVGRGSPDLKPVENGRCSTLCEAGNHIHKYQIGCGDQMGSEAFQLEHDEQFTNTELTAMIGEAVLAVLAQERKSWKRLPRSFVSIHREVMLWLVANKGFTKIEYEVNWWVDSSASIFDKGGLEAGDEVEDNNLLAIIDMVNAAGYDRTYDGYLFGHDIESYLFKQRPQTVEDAKQMIIDKFCTE